MYKYYVSIPLVYNSQSNLEEYDFNSDISLKFKNKIEYTINLKLSKGNFTSTEESRIFINNECSNFSIEIDSLYADNEGYAIEMATNLADKIVIVLSFITQSQNTNPHYFHTKFTYNLRNVKCIQSDYLRYIQFLESSSEVGEQTSYIILKDRLNVKDSVHNTMTYTIDVDRFDEILNKIYKSKSVNFIAGCYYRSLGEIDFRDKYYNLFSIIEFIENKYKNDSDNKPIFNSGQVNKIMENINSILEDELENPSHKQRINSRLKQIISTATEKSRAEKLCDILSKVFGITRIKKGAIEFEVNITFAKDLIDTRNGLFHAKEQDNNSVIELIGLTNKLLIVSEIILNKMIELNINN